MENQAQQHEHSVKIYIDRKEHSSPSPTTGAALYVLGKVKNGYDLFEEEQGPVDDKLIRNDGQEVRLKEFTHFYSAQRELNPGATRSDTSTKSQLLPDPDAEYLESKGYRFSEKNASGWIHVTLHDFLLPTCYCPGVCDLLVRLPPAYPNANPDMFWTRPDIRLSTGNWPARADVHESFDGESWQRWSRHVPPNSWRIGIDTLQTFIAMIKHELAKGL